MSFLCKQHETLHKRRLPDVTIVQNTQMWNPRPFSFYILGLYPTPRPQNYSSKGEQPSQVARHWIKNLPAVQETQETWLRSLGREEPWEEEMATHTVFLRGKFYGQRSLVACSPWGPKESNIHTKNSPPPTYLVLITALFPHLAPIGFKMEKSNSLREWGWRFSKRNILEFCQSPGSSTQRTLPQRNWRFVAVIVDFLQTLGFQSCLSGRWGEKHLVHRKVDSEQRGSAAGSLCLLPPGSSQPLYANNLLSL